MESQLPGQLTNAFLQAPSGNIEPPLEKLSKWLGCDLRPLPNEADLYLKNPDKDLIISDIHLPFHHSENLKLALRENLDATNLFMPGDVWDFYSVSHYRKRRNINLKDELLEGYLEIAGMAKQFETVYIMLSNHDQRIKKFVYDHVDPSLLALVETNVIELLLSTIPNVKLLQQQTRGTRKIDYVAQYRDVVFTHGEVSRTLVTGAVQEIEKRLSKWEDLFNIKDYHGLIQGHNHQAGYVQVGNKFLYQAPCMIDIDLLAFDYVFDGKMNGTPPAVGYIELFWKNNKFDPNRTRIVHL